MNYGKDFELKFKKDILDSIPNSSVDRLYDPMGYYSGVSNICDFIFYHEPNIFYLELKSHKGASIPFKNVTQYEKLREKVGIPGVRAGVIIWLYEKDNAIFYLPISTIEQMKNDGEKSFGIRHLNNNKYFYLNFPSKKKRVFYDTDYSLLLTLKDGQ